MHLLLTDVLTCPRCGPEFGLILLADHIDARRVLEGRLGCPNCRNQYPIHHGVLDVRLPHVASAEAEDAAPGPPRAPEAGDPEDAEAAVRLAALLGLAGASGNVLLVGPGAAVAPAISRLVEEVEVVALTPSPSCAEDEPGVSWIAAGPGLPFRGRSLRAVALTAGAGEALLAEALRVAQPGGRLVVERAAPGTADTLARLGAQLLLDQEGTVVARAVGEPVRPTVNSVR